MKRFVALYRGINVTGRNAVKMERLRAMHESLGHRDVKSYIQSGNVVFSASGTAQTIEQKVAARFTEEFGLTARVIVIEGNELLKVVQENPYAMIATQNPKLVHVGFCDGAADAKALSALLNKIGGREQVKVCHRYVYLYAPDGFGTSKFAAGMEKASGVAMTVRNWRTVETIAAMLEE